MSKNLSEEEILYISEQSGIDEDVIRSWHKEFLIACPKGKMVFYLDLKKKNHFL